MMGPEQGGDFTRGKTVSRAETNGNAVRSAGMGEPSFLSPPSRPTSVSRPRPMSGAAVPVLVTAGVLWLLGAFAAFYAEQPFHRGLAWAATHTPAWMLDLQGRWRGVPWDVMGQGALTLAAGAVAMWLGREVWARRRTGSGEDAMSGAVWGGGLVLGLWGTAIFLLGLVGAWRWPRPVFGALFVGSAMAAAVLRMVRVRRQSRPLAEDAPAGLSSPHPAPATPAPCLTRGEWLLAAPVLLIQALAFLYALTPAVQSDGLRYHLAAPQEWLKAGGPVYLPFNAFSNFPSTVEMLFLAGLGLAGDLLAKGFHFLFLPLTTLAVACLTRELGRGDGEDVAQAFQPACDGLAGKPVYEGRAVMPANHRQAGKPAHGRLAGKPAPLWCIRPWVLAAAVWGTLPVAVPLAGWEFIDLALVFFTLGVVHSLLRWLRTGRAGDWVAAALFGGLLVASKYTGVLTVVFGAVIMVLGGAWRCGWRGPLAPLHPSDPGETVGRFVVPALAGPSSEQIGEKSATDDGPAKAGTTNRPTAAGSANGTAASKNGKGCRVNGSGETLGRIVARAVAFGLIAAAFGGPWWAKNVVHTRNPVYPLAYSVFGGGGEWTQTCGDIYAGKLEEKGWRPVENGKMGSNHSLKAFLKLPWNTAVDAKRFEDSEIGPFFWVVTPWILFWVARAVWRWRRRPGPAVIALWMAFFVLSWFFTYQSNRFLMPALAVAAAVAAVTVGDAGRALSGRSAPAPRFAAALRALCALGVALPLVYGAVQSAFWLAFDEGRINARLESGVRWPAYTLGFLDRDAFLSERLPLYYPPARFASETLKPGEKVLLVGEHRKFHWCCAVEGNDWYDAPRILPFLKGAQTADEALDAMAAAGFTHVFCNLAEWGWPTDPGMLTGQVAVPPGSAWSYNRGHFDARELGLMAAILRSPRLEPVRVTVPGRVWLARLRPAGENPR